ncbi:YbfB/YjiJ family MFS transporter [Limnohabitans sp. Hippo3]|uniref:YbfB/YjiJ family MFS transporter n=1 Tax=Limnohabitans sp. Hippo3 TaxID=1597956 RepID=UPI000D352A27|nr:YbfB/YjiJ family MFS transporter [Limnohabitans sp. Hippo3]PUE43610.1 MFS transporter [Limnohabitans sp. Hippo3]
MSSHPTSNLQPWQVITGGICGLVLTIGLARFAFTPLLPLMQLQTGLSDAAAGGLAAINYAGYISGALAVAWIDDVRWRHRLYGWGLWMALLTTAAMALTTWMPAWGLSRYLGGLCGAGGMLLGSGLVLGWLMRQGRRPELGLYFIGIGLGVAVSALGAWGLSFLWPDWSSQWLAFAAIGLVFFVPAWLWRPPVPPLVAPSAASNSGPAVSRRWMLIMAGSYFAAGWGFVISATFTVAIVEREPALAGQGALAWALVGLAAMPAVFVWDKVARRLGDTRALLLAFALQTVAVVLPAVSGSLAAALLGAIGYGATFIGIVSLTLALVGRRAPQNPGKAMARLTLSYGAAQMVAPVVAGAMAQATGTFKGALWLTAGVMLLGMALLATLPEDAQV